MVLVKPVFSSEEHILHVQNAQHLTRMSTDLNLQRIESIPACSKVRDRMSSWQWHIWRLRNDRVFKGASPNRRDLVHSNLVEAKLWMLAGAKALRQRHAATTCPATWCSGLTSCQVPVLVKFFSVFFALCFSVLFGFSCNNTMTPTLVCVNILDHFPPAPSLHFHVWYPFSCQRPWVWHNCTWYLEEGFIGGACNCGESASPVRRTLVVYNALCRKIRKIR
jgi:hypothetical protein